VKLKICGTFKKNRKAESDILVYHCCKRRQSDSWGIPVVYV